LLERVANKVIVLPLAEGLIFDPLVNRLRRYSQDPMFLIDSP